MASPKHSGRMIRRSISESEKIASLSPEAAVLFMMLIPHFNSYGKMAAGPGVIKDEVVPLISYLTYENIPVYLQEISDKTNVKWFREGTKWWLHALHFLSEHQSLNKDKLGQDSLPTYPNDCEKSGTSPGLVLEHFRENDTRSKKRSDNLENAAEDEPGKNCEAIPPAPIEKTKPIENKAFSERTKVSPGLVRDLPSRAEGLKVRRKATTTATTPPISPPGAIGGEESRSERLFRDCFGQNEAKLRRLFPLADLAMEQEVCVAYYRNRSPPADPLPVILKWFQRIRNGGEHDPSTRKTRSEGRKTGIVPANGPDADWLGGSQFDPAGRGAG